MKKIAVDLGLGLERKKESMGICFIGKRKFSTFIDSYVEPIKGPNNGIIHQINIEFFTLLESWLLKFK